ncbi:MAG: PepSY-associated TM helix domain-containing protein [Campylobacter sp.]
MRKIFKSKSIFNIHLILSLICFIPLFIMALSGAIVSYQNEISNFINKDLMRVKSSGEKLSISEILTKFKDQTGIEKPMRIVIVNDENATVRIYPTKFDGFFLDPYTGEILGKDNGIKFVRTVLMIHRNLALSLMGDKSLGQLGKTITGLTTIIFIIILISGIYLYFPKLKLNFMRASRVNFKLKGFSFFYNIHSVFGLYFSAILLIASCTGLYYSYDVVRSGVNSVFGVEKSKDKPKKGQKSKEFDFNLAQNGYKIFQNKVGENFYEMTMIFSSDDKFRVIYTKNQGDVKRNEAVVDLKNKSLLNSDEIELSRKISSTIYDLHTGYFLGSFGQFIWSFATFFISVLIFSGFYMSARRIFKR